jgi:amidase
MNKGNVKKVTVESSSFNSTITLISPFNLSPIPITLYLSYRHLVDSTLHTINFVHTAMINVTSDMSWQGIAAAAQAHRAESIAAVEPPVPDLPAQVPLNMTTLPAELLSKDVVELTELPAETILHRIATGNLTSTQVTRAFLQRAGLASKAVNCITELLPERALKRAAELDQYYATNGRPMGPLHGLPISVKEHIAMKDLDLNAGFISWVGNVAPDDGLILKLLWRAGCVFHARTTEPQTLMHLETSSNIHGVTVNPYNINLTSGGSSGGEGALIGMRGSCLGIGTDIGGSIRSPAANQGLFGLKPTSYRLPLDGFAATMDGQEQIVPVVGPLSTSLEGIKIFMKTLIDQKPWLYEPSLVPVPWQDTAKQGSLVRTDPPRTAKSQCKKEALLIVFSSAPTPTAAHSASASS